MLCIQSSVQSALNKHMHVSLVAAGSAAAAAVGHHQIGYVVSDMMKPNKRSCAIFSHSPVDSL